MDYQDYIYKNNINSQKDRIFLEEEFQILEVCTTTTLTQSNPTCCNKSLRGSFYEDRMLT